MSLNHDDLRRMYRTMLLIRRFEEQAVAFFMAGELRGSLHPCIGQEATAVGAVFPLHQDDYLTCTYRGHGQAIAKGLDPKEGMAELLGRRTGCSQGKGGSMHYTDLTVGLLGENAIVGSLGRSGPFGSPTTTSFRRATTCRSSIATSTPWSAPNPRGRCPTSLSSACLTTTTSAARLVGEGSVGDRSSTGKAIALARNDAAVGLAVV